VKCPRCGARNYEGYLEYPWCHKCGLALVQCAYCVYLEKGKCRLGHRYATEEVQEEPLDCTDFWPKPEYDLSSAAEQEPSRRPLLWLGLVLVAVLAALAIGIHLAQPKRAVPNVFSLQFIENRQSPDNKLREVDIIVRNDTMRVVRGAELLLDRRLLAGFELVAVEGAEQSTRLDNDWIKLELGYLDALSARMVKLKLKPKQPGRFTLKGELFVHDKRVTSAATTLSSP